MLRILTAVLLFSYLFLAACQDTSRPQNDNANPENEQVNHRKKKSRSASDHAGNDNVAPDRDNAGTEENNPRSEADVINRDPASLVYTKHARCRMDCRHIDESEVQEILQKGRINYRKSEPAGRPDPKYAVEGTTHDGQSVRIVFAPAKRGTVVITVIDLDTDWTCHCK
jgi:acetylornithine deacetylase/succinyl-diaminopimelate desuccinylase-like protein